MSRTNTKNIHQLLTELGRTNYGLEREELAERLDVSRRTVTSLVKQLEDAKLVTELPGAQRELTKEGRGNGSPGRGRIPALLQLGELLGCAVGCDIGHGHLSVQVTNSHGRRLHEEIWTREDFDADTEGAATLAVAAEGIAECLDDAGVGLELVRGIGVGVPGPLADGEVAAPSFLLGWTDLPIKDEFEKALRKRIKLDDAPLPEILIENDANLCALAESRFGAAQNTDQSLFIKVATGIGMGAILGRLHHGAHGVAGELGHIAVPSLPGTEEESPRLAPTGVQPCTRCRQLNCLENVASCRAIVDRLRRTPGYPQDLAIETVIVDALENSAEHPLCHRAIAEAGQSIGLVLGQVVTLLDPEVIVLGGTLARAGDLLLKAVNGGMKRTNVGLASPTVKLIDDDRRASAGVEGAVALVLQETELLPVPLTSL